MQGRQAGGAGPEIDQAADRIRSAFSRIEEVELDDLEVRGDRRGRVALELEVTRRYRNVAYGAGATSTTWVTRTATVEVSADLERLLDTTEEDLAGSLRREALVDFLETSSDAFLATLLADLSPAL